MRSFLKGLGSSLINLSSLATLPGVRFRRSPNTYQPNGPRECARRVRQAEAIAAKRTMKAKLEEQQMRAFMLDRSHGFAVINP